MGSGHSTPRAENIGDATDADDRDDNDDGGGIVGAEVVSP